MEVGFNVAALLNADLNGIAILSGHEMHNLPQKTIESIFMAQGLRAVITTGGKFIGTDQKIYIKFQAKKAIGFLKIGKKKLFIRDAAGNIKEIAPLCLLDFYVHESQQRAGYGKMLFDKMLQTEFIDAKKIGYDRPSNKLLRFLEKNFNLVDYIPQNNNFVVYNDYFENTDFNKKLNNSFEKDGKNLFSQSKINDNISYGVFNNNKDNENNSSYNRESNQNKKYVNIPWATTHNSNNFVSSSSSYGAYYAFEKKSNNKFY